MDKEFFILLHGAWHGSWCWHLLADKLRQAGNTVVTPDFPGRNKLSFPTAYKDYLNSVFEILRYTQQRVVLVGHSLGGLHISQISALYPTKIKSLIYISAFLLNHNETVFLKIKNEKPSQLDKYLKIDKTGRLLTLNTAHMGKIFYNHCKKSTQKWAIDQLVPESSFPMHHILSITDHNFWNIPKYFFLTSDDQALRLDFQKKMVSEFKGDIETVTLYSDHLPFLSHCDELFGLFHQINL